MELEPYLLENKDRLSTRTYNSIRGYLMYINQFTEVIIDETLINKLLGQKGFGQISAMELEKILIEDKLIIKDTPELMNSKLSFFRTIWVYTKVGGKLVENHTWENLSYQMISKWEWYFKYRAALLQIKYPKYWVKLIKGNKTISSLK